MPLIFLLVACGMNIGLDIWFVAGFKMGVAGAAWATIISQAVSGILCLVRLLLMRDVLHITWRTLWPTKALLFQLIRLGLPSGLTQAVFSLAMLVVQSLTNSFGTTIIAVSTVVMRVDGFAMMPNFTFGTATTTFTGQNIGAGQQKRADKGTVITVSLSLGVTAVIVLLVCIFAAPAISLFTPDKAVIAFGVLFVRANFVFLLFNCVNHVLAGALRGRGDSTAPMAIMLLTFVLLRQIYLFVVTRFVANTPWLVGFGYPVGWMACCVIEVSYYFLRWGRKKPQRQLLPDC